MLLVGYASIILTAKTERLTIFFLLTVTPFLHCRQTGNPPRYAVTVGQAAYPRTAFHQLMSRETNLIFPAPSIIAFEKIQTNQMERNERRYVPLLQFNN